MTDFTISECLSYCEQGFPEDCASVVYKHNTKECQLRNASRNTPDFTLTASTTYDYFELIKEGIYDPLRVNFLSYCNLI